MTSGWAIVQGATTVNLPVAPSSYDVGNPVQVDEVGIDSSGVVLVARFPRTKTVSLSGTFATGASNATILSTYLTPIEGMKGKQVTITDPDSQFTGTFLLQDFQYHRVQQGVYAYYTFTLVLEYPSGTTTIVSLF